MDPKEWNGGESISIKCKSGSRFRRVKSCVATLPRSSILHVPPMPYNTRRHNQSRPPPPDALHQLTTPVLAPSPISPNVPEPSLLPPGVAMHPEDASSRVFTAIRASMASVSNRAMTVKDLAEHCLKHGLVCTGGSPYVLFNLLPPFKGRHFLNFPPFFSASMPPANK